MNIRKSKDWNSKSQRYEAYASYTSEHPSSIIKYKLAN